MKVCRNWGFSQNDKDFSVAEAETHPKSWKSRAVTRVGQNRAMPPPS